MSHFSGHFEGALTFLTPKLSLEMAHKVILPPKNNYIPQFLKQRDINSYIGLLKKSREMCSTCKETTGSRLESAVH
jgi:hypothetical protein